jgi:hypothetical protein
MRVTAQLLATEMRRWVEPCMVLRAVETTLAAGVPLSGVDSHKFAFSAEYSM